jgi:hypothetical protein
MIVRLMGPYAAPGHEKATGLPPLPKAVGGLYADTYQQADGAYRLRGVGVSVDIRERWKTHVRDMKTGMHSILDPEQAARGAFKELHHGFGWSDARRIAMSAELERCKEEDFQAAVRRQLDALRIFISSSPNRSENGRRANRESERIEGAIWRHLHRNNAPLLGLSHRRPGENDALAHRAKIGELSYTAIFACESKLLDLPPSLPIDGAQLLAA